MGSCAGVFTHSPGFLYTRPVATVYSCLPFHKNVSGLSVFFLCVLHSKVMQCIFTCRVLCVVWFFYLCVG